MDIRSELGKRILFFDGGLGSLLQEKGLAAGELPEIWNITHPEILTEIHEAYANAGADIIMANTFGINRLKYPGQCKELVRAAFKNVKEGIRKSGKQCYAGLDIGPTGKLLQPLGELAFEDAVDLYAEIIKEGTDAGADLIVIETMNDTYELKAAVCAAKENSTLPIFATVIFGESGKLLTGANPAAVTALLEGLGVDAIGMNCGLGPKQMAEIFSDLEQYASLPLIVNPNAGLPHFENGQTCYDVTPEEFAEDMELFIQKGAWLVGGCCGTTPAHIRETVARCRELTPKPRAKKQDTIVSSYSNAVILGEKPVIIGERINPTGKARFKQALRENDIDYVLEAGVKQADAGAHILDVNVGLPDIDEITMMKQVVSELQGILPLPLQLDTTNPLAMEQAMRIYNGKPMINSVNGKEEVMAQIFPLVKKYGGVVVGLTLDENGIPDTVEGRMAIAEKIYQKAAEYGISKKDIVIDALTMAVSTDQNAANITLETVRQITAMGGKTVLGVSNISFGLPVREYINSAFYTMALQAGLSAGIINPNNAAMRRAYDTFCVLSGADAQCADYIDRYAAEQAQTPKGLSQISGGASNQSAQQETNLQHQNTSLQYQDTSLSEQEKSLSEQEKKLSEYVIKGLKEPAYQATKALLSSKDTMDIINHTLVPALDIVGKGFEKGTMFLPQLLMSAEAAKSGFEAIKEFVTEHGSAQDKKGTIVIATVKGDIHDIGKNIVKVLLENYGYDVIDLGKDVPPETILEAVQKSHAPLVGLSALMTTTVVFMEETINLLKKEAPWCKIMVGGAVLTQEYSNQIGADFYGKDAMQSVHYAQQIVTT